MSAPFALLAPALFDGERQHENAALIIADGRIKAFSAAPDLPPDMPRTELDNGLIAPGFVDLQVNGGGGVQFNAEPTTDAIAKILRAHARFGTTALLVTLITDDDAVRDKAISAAIAAGRQNLPGFAGLHLEGPHLARSRKGTHDPRFMRPMTDRDLEAYRNAAAQLPALLITLAPEQVTPPQIAGLVEAGIVVSLGHTDATAEQIGPCLEAGASMVTHLFNAQSQITVREPGLAGMALNEGRLNAGLIADGHHVDPRVMRLALRAKQGPGRIFLVTDAMAPTGTELTEFALGNRTIYRREGRLTLKNGTLAGADLDMAQAVRSLVKLTGLATAEALRMAALYAAEAMGWKRSGRLRPGDPADMVWLDNEGTARATWIGGQQQS